jgi:hypothetical protein
MSSSIDHGAELDAGEKRAMARAEAYEVTITKALLNETLRLIEKRQYLDAISCLSNANANLIMALEVHLQVRNG